MRSNSMPQSHTVQSHTFQLSVQRNGNSCTFELSDGNMPRQVCQLSYPPELDELYQNWQSAYLGYYQQLGYPQSEYQQTEYQQTRFQQFRGEKVASGQITMPSFGASSAGFSFVPAIDSRKQLVQANTQLLDAFHNWLRSAKLHNIRAAIAKVTHQTATPHWVDICLRCTSINAPLELARLPWETWEIGQELGVSRRVRLAREPQNIRDDTIYPIRRRARILAIFGDSKGLNLSQDLQAINSLHAIAQVEALVCQDYQDKSVLLQTICQKIEDPTGWDILFFAGHSNESNLTGGEISVSSNVALFVADIAHSLKAAKQNGLQFAMFNSCRGLNIAESLIDLGISQVAIMREPIHDQVAHIFIKQFLASLASYKDVHESLLDACECLKQQNNTLEYPSAHWVPSLFRHPHAELFRIQPFGWRQHLQRRIPTRREALGLAACLLVSLLPPVQDLLLDGRLGTQALNRQLTNDIPAQVEAPILLVKIDPLSLATANIDQPRPIRQDYLARIIGAATERNAEVIGIDYLLDDAAGEPTVEQRAQLKQAIAQADRSQTPLVFAYDASETSAYAQQGYVSEQLIPFNQAHHGEINFYPTLLDLPASGTDCGSRPQICPFAYELARLHAQKTDSTHSKPQTLFSITSFFNNLLWQAWFHPIVDFSLPPDGAYRTISACELLDECKGQGNQLTDLRDSAVLIASGGYKEAGIDQADGDSPHQPLALAAWQKNDTSESNNNLQSSKTFQGGDLHAYMLHHLLTSHRVYAIPDLWMILLIAITAKELSLHAHRDPQKRKYWALSTGGISLSYGFLCLQIFRLTGIITPIVLPVIVLWLYGYFSQHPSADNQHTTASL